MKILKQNKYWINNCRQEKYEKIRKKILNSFSDLIFDEEPHKYYLNGEELECVSNITHIFKPHFNTDIMAEATHRRNFDNPESKYYQMSIEEIKQQWKNISTEACTVGTNRHNFGESVFWWQIGEYDKIVPEFKDRFIEDEDGNRCVIAKYPKEEAILDFWNDLPNSFIPILAENKVYNVNNIYRYSGTFDILFYYDAEIDGLSDKKSGFVILDYKTNKDLYKNFNEQKLLPPFNEMLDNSLNIYKLQLAAYQLCLEKIGFNIIGRRLIWLKPTGKYEKVPLEDMSKRLDVALRNHYKEKN